MDVPTGSIVDTWRTDIVNDWIMDAVCWIYMDILYIQNDLNIE